MLSVADAVFTLVNEREMLAEGLARNLFNLSALARELRDEVAGRVKKPVKEGAIIMALARLSSRLRGSEVQKKTSRSFVDMTVRSGLVELTYANSPSLLEKQQVLFSTIQNMKDIVCTISNGAYETTIITGKKLEEAIRKVFSAERLISSYTDLSSISIKLHPSVVETRGAYAWLLNVVAWQGINLVEVVSTYTELTVVVREKDIDRAFAALHSALKKS